MKSKASSHPFVRIRIGSAESTKFREVKLTRAQFEVCLIVLPVVVIWGIVSTVLLTVNMRDTTRRQAEQGGTQGAKKIATLSVPTEISLVDNGQAKSSSTAHIPQPASAKKTEMIVSEMQHAKILPVSEAPIEKKTATDPAPQQVSRGRKIWMQKSFDVDETFAVKSEVFASSSSSRGPFTLGLAIDNLTQQTQAGRFWIRLAAVTASGDTVWFSATPNVLVGETGNASNPNRGVYFSFRHRRTQNIALKGPDVEVERFTEVLVGFEQSGQEQIVSREKL